MDNYSIFDLLPEEEAVKFRPIKSNDWKWTMKDDYPKEKNGLTVFSCFACGGGSTMGYKLAGCEVVGCCEIDKKMNDVYIKNHHPKHNFLMDIREFNKISDNELPQELFNLDILDGSPPCTTFSMAGERKASWGKKKKFREGQTEQTLDDLPFVFIETVEKLKPKVVIMENVEGLLKGEAFTYVQKIYKNLMELGYQVKHWVLKGEHMGVPQRRHRVFFVAQRNDIYFDLQGLDMSFNYEPITYGEIKCGTIQATPNMVELLSLCKYGEKDLVKAWNRKNNPCGQEKRMLFNYIVSYDEYVLQTISGDHNTMFDFQEKARVSEHSISNASTFPQDYDYCGERISYICGMSVPPIMIKRIVTRLIEQGVFDYKLKRKDL
jgi:DNA (cytosine-5)-methyltransferase 1